MSNKLLFPITLVALLVFSSGCKLLEPAGQPGTLENAKAPPDWKPYEANLAQRALLNIQTQYVDVVKEVVKWQTNTTVQVVTNIVEKAIPVPVYNGWITNTIVVTNIDTQLVERLTSQISSITNQIAEHVTVGVKQGVQMGTSAIGVIPGYGQIAGAGVAGALALFAAYTQRKLNQSNDVAKVQAGQIVVHQATNSAFVQEIEAGKELLSNVANTPQGVQALELYKRWLREHQTAAGVIGQASEIVKTEVNNQEAQFVANLLAKGEVPKTA